MLEGICDLIVLNYPIYQWLDSVRWQKGHVKHLLTFELIRNFRFAENELGNAISPLHDIPLYANDEKTIYNMVVEVPRWTNAKMEVSLLFYL